MLLAIKTNAGLPLNPASDVTIQTTKINKINIKQKTTLRKEKEDIIRRKEKEDIIRGKYIHKAIQSELYA